MWSHILYILVRQRTASFSHHKLELLTEVSFQCHFFHGYESWTRDTIFNFFTNNVEVTKYFICISSWQNSKHKFAKIETTFLLLVRRSHHVLKFLKIQVNHRNILLPQIFHQYITDIKKPWELSYFPHDQIFLEGAFS